MPLLFVVLYDVHVKLLYAVVGGFVGNMLHFFINRSDFCNVKIPKNDFSSDVYF